MGRQASRNNPGGSAVDPSAVPVRSARTTHTTTIHVYHQPLAETEASAAMHF
jgi:hypothetical protein